MLPDDVRERFRAAGSDRCEKVGCKLVIDGFDLRPVLLDCDSYCAVSNHSGPICDYLIFIESLGEEPLIAVSVEMKSRSLHARKAAEQLQAGAELIDHLLDRRGAVTFVPILLSRALQAAELKILTSLKVRFRGRDLRIVRKKCGSRLRDIVN